jgi:hypothetical protein
LGAKRFQKLGIAMQKHTPLFCSESFSAFSSFCLFASSQHLRMVVEAMQELGDKCGRLVRKGVFKPATAHNLKCWLASPQILVLFSINQEMEPEEEDEESEELGDGGENTDW